MMRKAERKEYDGIKEAILKELAPGVSMERAYMTLNGLRGNVVEELVLDLIKVSDNVFDALLEFARIYQNMDVLGAIINRRDMVESRIKLLFRQAMARVRAGGQAGTWSGSGDEHLLWMMARRGYLGKDEIGDLIDYQRGCERQPQDNWVAGVLAYTVMEAEQIKEMVESRNTGRDWRWVRMAEQENANDETWELMLELAREEGQVESVFIWGRILGHKNAGIKWKERWEKMAITQTDANRGEVAQMLLSNENLGEEWDVDELVKLYAKRDGRGGEIEMEGWSENVIGRISQRAMAGLLRHPNKNVRLGAIRLMGQKYPRVDRKVSMVKRG